MNRANTQTVTTSATYDITKRKFEAVSQDDNDESNSYEKTSTAKHQRILPCDKIKGVAKMRIPWELKSFFSPLTLIKQVKKDVEKVSSSFPTVLVITLDGAQGNALTEPHALLASSSSPTLQQLFGMFKLKMMLKYLVTTSEDSITKKWFIEGIGISKVENIDLKFMHDMSPTKKMGDYSNKATSALLTDLNKSKYELLLTGSYDRTISLWDINTGQLVSSKNCIHRVACMAWWQYNGKLYLLEGGGGGCSCEDNIKTQNVVNIRLRNSQTFELDTVKVLEGHQNTIRALLVYSHNNTLLSCGDDNKIILWNLITGENQNFFRSLQ